MMDERRTGSRGVCQQILEVLDVSAKEKAEKEKKKSEGKKSSLKRRHVW